MSDRLQPALSDSHYEAALAAAVDIGKEEGTAAASWVFDGNTERHVYAWYLSGITDGDPEILDALPSADLSGQWADGRTPTTLAIDVTNAASDDTRQLTAHSFTPENIDQLCDVYEAAFNDAVCAEVERIARQHLA